MPQPALKPEFDYYLSHHDEFVTKFLGRFVVIKNQAVIGVYDSDLEAVTEASKKEPLGTFLVQKVEPGRESYTQSFHSRVAFA
jgi:hypothetical protein